MTHQELEEIKKRVEGKCECQDDTPCDNCYFGYEEVRDLISYIDSLHKQIEEANSLILKMRGYGYAGQFPVDEYLAKHKDQKDV